MKSVFLFLLLLLFLLVLIGLNSCTKPEGLMEKHTCLPVYEYSDRYTADSVYKGTVEIKPWGLNNVQCDAWLDSINAHKSQWIHNDPATCPPLDAALSWFYLEHRRYVTGNEISNPVIFKH